ncbi:Hypothetical protein FKW44_014356 [Caligus rogercresseyi]|uniref:Uncharacterized protein n=1 Tax=Caligus rogercresseyi TaxID=217165 RepID=A0A7T8GYR8_CALRO|nr:Hypothetical protein FKW44_014355 [Caligus rogercresseyi]QQP40348.1 Hypothetical protein FKW44_014356 [Caligus rogercresseyi]
MKANKPKILVFTWGSSLTIFFNTDQKRNIQKKCIDREDSEVLDVSRTNNP